MWDREKLNLYTQFLNAQEQAVLEALSNGIGSLNDVKVFVATKLDNDVDQDYITTVWTQNMDLRYDNA